MIQYLKLFRPAVLLLLVMTAICGVVYTGIITGAAQLFFHGKANGGIITVTRDGGAEDIGSALISQEFTQPKYLIGRPEEVSNLSPVSAEQAALVKERIGWWNRFDPNNKADVPADLAMAPGSAADPGVSPEAAEFQVPRIAKARNMPPDDVRAVIRKYTSGRFLGFIGEPWVNVLKVNLALDGLI